MSATASNPAVSETLPAAVGTDNWTVLLTEGLELPGTLGGKGHSLGQLISSGVPVPTTGMVTTAAYRSIASNPSVMALVRRLVGDRSANGQAADGQSTISADEVDRVFAELIVPEPLRNDILKLAEAVGQGDLVAVRSSATVEDLHGSSFAGQYRSLLNVDPADPRALLAAVKSVWASLWHPAPTAYRDAFGIDQSDVAMAVVLMRMVPATTAGVIFTDDPGGSGGARVEAVEGLGESLVSGQRTPSAWVVGGSGPDDETALPEPARRALVLAKRIADQAGVPQDIEWAAVDDEVMVVQARPITVLEDSDGFDTTIDDHELTTAGIVEMVPGVLPPLRWEINRFLLEESFRSILDSLGILRGRSAEDRPFVRRVRGRAAIDFDQLRDAAAGIPGAVEELEMQYFGQTSTGNKNPDQTAGREAAHRLAVPHSFGFSDLARDLRTLQTRKRVIDQAEVVIKASRSLRDRRPYLADMGSDRLLGYSRRLVDLAARGLAAELGVAAAGAASYRRLELQLGRHLGANEGVLEAQALTAHVGIDTGRQPAASAAVFAGPSWAEMASGPPAGLQPKDRSSADDEWRRVRGRLRALPGWTRRRVLTGGFVDLRTHLIKRLTADVVDQIQRRERAKSAVLELGGEVRRVHLELGRRLVERGTLENVEEVELLSSSELLCTLSLPDDGTAGLTPDVIRRRRNWLSRYQAEGHLPVRFVGIPTREPEPLPEGDVLDGWAASPGRRRGVAKLITSAGQHLDDGAVLVAEATDASWSPLFMRAGAVVVERGGPLSHAAILARELGLPAVLNVPGASRVLDGCVVSVDGDQGVVVIESRNEKP